MRAGISVTTALVALTLVGCGDAEEGTKSSPEVGVTASAARESRDAPATDRAQIRALLATVQQDYDSGDGEAYCEKLIPSERREVAAFGRNLDRGTNCEATIEESSRLGKARGVVQRPTTFLSARIDGDRAVAKVSNGGRPPEPVVFVRRGGEWKIVESGFEPDPLQGG